MVRKKATTRRKTTTRRKAPAKKKKAKSRVNEAGNYTKPTMRKRLFQRIKAGSKGGAPGQWSARKAQMLAKQYKAKGGGYRLCHTITRLTAIKLKTRITVKCHLHKKR